MSIFGMMRTATSGIGAQSQQAWYCSDNIANASTHGYKRAFTEFSTWCSSPVRARTCPRQRRNGRALRHLPAGRFDYTTSKTDLGVSGNGFFLVGDGSGATLPHARGRLVRQDGRWLALLNAAGIKLLGYPIVNGQASASANGTARSRRSTLSTLALTATPSTSSTFHVNLPEEAVAPAGMTPANTRCSLRIQRQDVDYGYRQRRSRSGPRRLLLGQARPTSGRWRSMPAQMPTLPPTRFIRQRCDRNGDADVRSRQWRQARCGKCHGNRNSVRGWSGSGA